MRIINGIFSKVAGQTIDRGHALDKMNPSNASVAPIHFEADMKNARQHIAARGAKAQFNYNKLQAAACMASSAAVSIALIYWAIKSLF